MICASRLEEAAALLKEVHKVELAPEDVSALNARTEGWAVGLMMAALSIGKHKDIPGFIASFTGSQRYVMDYLIEEVLRQQPPEIQDFLLKTSVLERLTAPLCDFLTGHVGSQEMLVKTGAGATCSWFRWTSHGNGTAIIISLPSCCATSWKRSPGLEEVTALHQRASQWYEDHGFPDDAIHHALAARDWERAMRLLYDPDEKRIKLGETVTLLNWLKAVPEEVLRTHRQLYRQFAQLLINAGEFDAAEAVLGYLEQTAQDDTNLQGEIAVLRAGVAQNLGDYPRAMELSTRALSLACARTI